MNIQDQIPRKELDAAHLAGLRLTDSQRKGASRTSVLARSLQLMALIALLGVAAYLGTKWKPEPATTQGATPAPTPKPDPLAPTKSDLGGASAQEGLTVNGFIVARQRATVSSAVSGRIQVVLIKEGERVKKGDPLAILDARDTTAQLEMAHSQLRSAEARMFELENEIARAQREAERAKMLGDRGMLAASGVEDAALKLEGVKRQLASARENRHAQQINLELAGIAKDNTTIRAPLSGIVIATSAQPGEIVAPLSAVGSSTRSGICTIADLDTLEVELEIAERLLHKIKPGQAVSVALDALPNTKLKGIVARISPLANKGGGSVPVHIAIETNGQRILPDMTATVSWDKR